VGDVLHVDDVVPGIVPGPHQQVPGEEGGRVPDVRRVVGGDAARVHGRGRPDRRPHHFTGRGVVDVRLPPLSRQGGNVGRTPGVHGARLIAAAGPGRRPWAGGRWHAARVSAARRPPARTRTPARSASARSTAGR